MLKKVTERTFWYRDKNEIFGDGIIVLEKNENDVHIETFDNSSGKSIVDIPVEKFSEHFDEESPEEYIKNMGYNRIKKVKKMYRVADLQFHDRYYAEGATFENLKQVCSTFIEYHSTDCDVSVEEELFNKGDYKQCWSNISEFYDWGLEEKNEGDEEWKTVTV